MATKNTQKLKLNKLKKQLVRLQKKEEIVRTKLRTVMQKAKK